MTDNITLPREAVEKIHEAWSSEVYPPAASMEWYDIMDALRTALAAEQPKPEPVRCNPADYCAARHMNLYTAPPDAEALRRDAERYRWLRDKAPPDIGDMASVRDSHDPSEIDAAIDAAMKEDKT